MNLKNLNTLTVSMKSTERMPVLFVGHGSPMNAIEDNEFTQAWHNTVMKIQKPQAILCISAHWETKGTFVTAMSKPQTIHDFGGFPQKLFEVQYPASGNKELAEEIKDTVKKTSIVLSNDWGLDHGCWVPIMKMYPEADIPIIQLSLDYTQGAQYHYDLAKELAPLRKKGVLIISSGNMVHNLRMIHAKSLDDLHTEYGYDWAYEMNDIFKKKITEQDHKSLINYTSLSKAAVLAIPTTDHYFPLLYSLALQENNEQSSFFNDKVIAGSLTMTSVIIDKA